MIISHSFPHIQNIAQPAVALSFPTTFSLSIDPVHALVTKLLGYNFLSDFICPWACTTHNETNRSFLPHHPFLQVLLMVSYYAVYYSDIYFLH